MVHKYFYPHRKGKKLIYTLLNKIWSVIKVWSELNCVIRNLSYYLS